MICKQNEKSKVVDLLKSELRPVHSCIGGGLVGEGSHNPTAMSRALLEVIVSGTASTLVYSYYITQAHRIIELINNDYTYVSNGR